MSHSFGRAVPWRGGVSHGLRDASARCAPVCARGGDVRTAVCIAKLRDPCTTGKSVPESAKKCPGREGNRFPERNEFHDALRREVIFDDRQETAVTADMNGRSEVVQRVEGELELDDGGDRMRTHGKEQGMTVGRCLGDHLRYDDAVGAGTVFGGGTEVWYPTVKK